MTAPEITIICSPYQGEWDGRHSHGNCRCSLNKEINKYAIREQICQRNLSSRRHKNHLTRDLLPCEQNLIGISRAGASCDEYKPRFQNDWALCYNIDISRGKYENLLANMEESSFASSGIWSQYKTSSTSFKYASKIYLVFGIHCMPEQNQSEKEKSIKL